MTEITSVVTVTVIVLFYPFLNMISSAGVKIAKKIRIERKIIAERFVIYCLALQVLLNLSIFLALKILPEP